MTPRSLIPPAGISDERAGALIVARHRPPARVVTAPRLMRTPSVGTASAPAPVTP